MDEPLLASELLEVAWQRVPNLTPSPEQAHLHRQTVEVNVVLGGSVRLRIDGVAHELGRADFYVVWPEFGCERYRDGRRRGGARRAGAERRG